MANYGIPYMGSKDKIIASIAMNFPKADHFYDLFGGGFSVTHYMLQNKKNCYKYFHYNELNPLVVDVVKKSLSGDFSKTKPRFITRDEFFEKKDIDGYIRTCWSFGNSGISYLFSKEIETYKKSMHNAVVFDIFDDLAKEVFKFEVWPEKYKSTYQKRIYLRNLIEYYRLNKKLPKILYQFLDDKKLKNIDTQIHFRELQQLERLQSLEQLQQLERLQSLEQLQQLERLNITNLSYEQVEILPNSLVYCDIPYKNTNDYENNFDHNKFYDWASTRNFPVYISEFNIDDPRFKLIYKIEKRALMNGASTKNHPVEKLYWNGVS